MAPPKAKRQHERKDYVEVVQQIQDDVASSTPRQHKDSGKPRPIDRTLLHHDDYRYGPFLIDGQASPILNPQNPIQPPIPSTRATTRQISGRPFSRTWCASQWQRHRAPFFVFGAQFFGALMNLFARLLELADDGAKLHPMQLLLWRMLLTTLACSTYIVWKRIPHGLLGAPEVRKLLVPRGLSGFFGIYGVWYSIQYLPLAEATVITFLAPLLAGYWCHLFLRDPYTRTEQLASFLALGGVVLITRPTSLFSSAGEDDGPVRKAIEAIANATITATEATSSSSTTVDPHSPTTAERIGAIGVALLGVLGTSVAFTTLRAIGSRAHTLISVNYFSVACLAISASALSLSPYLDIGQPDMRLAMPSSLHQWALVLVITLCGFATQVLITKGLTAERSNRATAMTYTQMLFAAGFDRFVWGTTMGWVSATGCAMIIAGAVWVAAGKNAGGKEKAGGGEADLEMAAAVAVGSGGIESVPMLGEEEEEDELEGQEEGVILGNVR
ncbi:hypothetical protein F4808DRAFT_68011 [Astrocystis sublimbata]|nr:hypothetical protein F4808DRAFT_68011 [Astrocystis sublimbata]